jgi:plastocyanin
MRLRRRYVSIAALLGVMGASLSVAVGSEPTPTVEAVNSGLYSHSWSPAQVSVAPGGSVTISNPTTIPHGVEWVAGPSTPTCDSGVPVGTTSVASGKEWSGSCKFTQAGAYTYYCTVHGAEMTGTVTVLTPGAPTSTTGAASSIGQTGATLEGTVNPQGKATTYHFNYGTSTSYGLQTGEVSAGEGEAAKAVSAPVSGLAAGVTYHYQLVAKNDSGTTPGVDRTFTTIPAPGAPTAITGSAGGLSETDATLSGTVNPDGEATEYFFEWGLSNSYGNTTSVHAVVGEDHAEHAASAALTGLLPGTVYHYRLVAKNASGSTPGIDLSFTTQSPPASKPEAPSGPPSGGAGASSPPPATIASSPPPPPPAPAKTTASGPLLSSLKLTAPRHGSALRGTVEVAASGRLEVDLLAKSSSLGKTRSSKAVAVGRLVRGSVSAGKVSFSLSLTARGKQALKAHRSLVVSVKVVLTPKQGPSASSGKSVTLRL